MLLDVAHEWVGILNDEAAAAKMAELKANLPKTYFAWSGDTKNGGLAYYRIQGPTVIIEYARSRVTSITFIRSTAIPPTTTVRSSDAMSTRHLVWPGVVVGWLCAAAPADAHRLDEYLQATRIGVSQDRIDLEIDLTAGASIANGDLRDWSMPTVTVRSASAEGDEYARRVIDALRLSVDGGSQSIDARVPRVP